MTRKRYLTLLAVAALPLQALATDIPMVGLDDAGNPMEVLVPDHEVASTLTTAIQSFHGSTLQALQERQAQHSAGQIASQEQTPVPWTLRSVVIGVGTNIELGLGPVTVGALPRFRMGFSNQPEPSVP